MVARAAGLQSHPQHHIFVRDFKGSSGLFSFQLNDSFSAVAVDELCDSLRVRGPAHQPLPLPPAPAGTRRRALHALGSLCVAVGSSPVRRGVTVRLLCVLRVRWRARCACVARALRVRCACVAWQLFAMGYSWGGFESLILPCNISAVRSVEPWQVFSLSEPSDACLSVRQQRSV